MNAKFVADMFVLSLPIAEKIIRPTVVYIFLIVGLRLAGKRELAQLNTFDLVVLLTLSNTVQNAIIGEDNSVTGGLIGAATLLILNYSLVRFLYYHDQLDRIVEGVPEVVMEHGELKMDKLEQELISRAELEVAAHKQGFSSLDDIDRAVLDPGGGFCFFAKKPTAEDSRHADIMARLNELSAQLAALQAARG
jgi:uncharacterized membrane protein YcaP (DUF421 family)